MKITKIFSLPERIGISGWSVETDCDVDAVLVILETKSNDVFEKMTNPSMCTVRASHLDHSFFENKSKCKIEYEHVEKPVA